MSSDTVEVTPPPDHAERVRALDASRSILVEAPAGSGKTDLLTRRFLRLLAEVDEPGQIVAITFTKAAAAEMRHRILAELEKAAERASADKEADAFSMEALAARALDRSRERGWNLIDLPGQLRISTIDAFCRELAVQQPLLSGLGGGLDIFEDPNELYRRAARKTLEHIDSAEPELRAALERLLLWRDNGWLEMENLLIEMLARRDRWMQNFVFGGECDWELLRAQLEQPFARAARPILEALSALFDAAPGARDEAQELARFACENSGGQLQRDLAEMAEFPVAPFADAASLEEAWEAYACLADLLLTGGSFRQRVDKRHGFPADAKAQKQRLLVLIARLREVQGFETALAAIGGLPPVHYTEEDWQIVRACFVLLRRAAVELKVVFAEAGAVDYTEVAQVAMHVLQGEEGIPGEGALAMVDDIHHLLVDEFQDTSRKQHRLLARLIAAWPEREGRTCFVVGDPMQSIYFFRDADAELFPQVRDQGLNIPGDQPLTFDLAALKTNFRTKRSLVERLNEFFAAVFAKDDGSGVRFTGAESPQAAGPGPAIAELTPRLHMRFDFMPAAKKSKAENPASAQAGNGVKAERDAARDRQIKEIVELVRSHAEKAESARMQGEKYRIAVLGRARTALTPIAEALRKAEIPFRAVELEKLKERLEVKDALAMVRALLNPHDRVAWLGVLRAPWCGLSLEDMHTLASADDPSLRSRPVRELMAERAKLLTEQGRGAVERVRRALEAAEAWRTVRPAVALGTWMEEVWQRLGGAACVDEAARANVDLLWKCLDRLPEGDADVVGSALDAALENLTALPDPRVDGDYGVQLMTIHKAKGLEFEVVIVPDLQARTGRNRSDLLSWLERGLAAPEDADEVTEFLVAPIPAKGGEKNTTRKWVDAERNKREMQEARRILYVAATRAREELYTLARLEFKSDANGDLILVEPKACLLETAWPAVQDEAQRQFELWKAGRQAEPAEVETIAAVADNVVEMPAPVKPVVLHRLPADVVADARREEPKTAEAMVGRDAELSYRRHEGGLISRAFGIAVHSVFEELARRRAICDWDAARKAVVEIAPRLAAEARACGIAPALARRVASQAVDVAVDASQDALAQWILSPHEEAASEARWTGVFRGKLHVVRVDRVFRAGLEPGSESGSAWWIIDYKTTHAEGLDPSQALPQLRVMFAPQLEAYARVLRGLHGADAEICAGLYYPRMKKLDWWKL